MALLLTLFCLAAAALAFQTIGSWIDARRFPPLGRMVDIGSCHLHLNVQGSGQPVVLLEAGIGASSLSWSAVHSELAQFSTVCAYDRAGLGWSSLSPAKSGLHASDGRTLDQMLGELDALLQRAGIDGPLLLVGHSFGGLLMRVFAQAHPERVLGVVLVDPVSLCTWGNCSAEQQKRIAAGARLSRRGAILARIGVVRFALYVLSAGGRWIPKLIAGSVAAQGTGVMERLATEVSKLPREVQPMVRAHWSRPKAFLAMAGYLEALPANAAAASHGQMLAKIPVTILSAGNATAEELREREEWADHSECGRHVQIPETGHWIQLERPDLVVAAIREMVSGQRNI